VTCSTSSSYSSSSLRMNAEPRLGNRSCTWVTRLIRWTWMSLDASWPYLLWLRPLPLSILRRTSRFFFDPEGLRRVSSAEITGFNREASPPLTRS